jgi:hypothetical protein
MPQPIPNPIENLSVKEAAAAVVQLINSTPRTPWPQEIEAIIAKAVDGRPTPASPALPEIRKTVTRIQETFDVLRKLHKGGEFEAVEAEVYGLQRELEGLEGQVPSRRNHSATLWPWRRSRAAAPMSIATAEWPSSTQWTSSWGLPPGSSMPSSRWER